MVVTGGSSGLGREIVAILAGYGARVAVLDIVVPKDDSKVAGATYYCCDVSQYDEVQSVSLQIKAGLGVVTVLINNAGIVHGKALLELSIDEIHKTLNVNLVSSFYTTKVFLPDMLAMFRGYIVTMGSVLGYMSPALLSDYGASKAGLVALHESLTYELGSPLLNSSGVKTLLICPGQLKTSLFEGVLTPLRLFAPELEPAEVAQRLVKALELGQRGEIRTPLYGKIFPVFRAAPWPLVDLVRHVSGIDRSMASFKKVSQKLTAELSGSCAS